ncbi:MULTISPECIES: isochorismatase family protein [unclassified Pseudomonas]|uniref:isochorismatase family protein n=1 Tax=unclassified Pseudomonas TaxID=196821 RepID=UPI00257DCF03|nr:MULTISPECIES: isochorismatase family protein [unclassified Pseudomonas]
MSSADSVHLLIIDPQNDFCDIADAALPVPEASADLRKVASLIHMWGHRLDAIHVTLDSHQPLHIAHPSWWQDAKGHSPPPFTVISVDDIEQGRWTACVSEKQSYSLEYVKALAERGRYQLTIWPEHCLIGSWGHNVYTPLLKALNEWGRTRLKTVHYIPKGSNPNTEHYSAIAAEVPDPDDPGTRSNTHLLNQLEQAQTVLIAGEALSHCVAGTVRDIADHLGETNLHRLVLLTDCSHAVPGFEHLAECFIEEMKTKGVRCLTSKEAEPLLAAS